MGATVAWDNLLSGLLGSIVGGLCSVGAVWFQSTQTRADQRVAEKRIIRSYLLSLRTEVETLWKRYEETAGQLVTSLGLNQPLLGFWPVTHDYFTVYNTNAFLLGRVEDDELRTLIVRTYNLAKGIVDSFRMNNEMNSKLENAQLLALQTQNPAFTQIANVQHQNLVNYATMLKARHNELKDHVERLLRAIGNSV